MNSVENGIRANHNSNLFSIGIILDNSTNVFGPLVFEDNKYECLQQSDATETKCLLCDDSFNLKLSLPMFLAHIFDVHSIVIEDVQNIDNLNE